MKALVLIVVAAFVLMIGSTMAIMNNACKTGYHAWCVPMSVVRHQKSRPPA